LAARYAVVRSVSYPNNDVIKALAKPFLSWPRG